MGMAKYSLQRPDQHSDMASGFTKAAERLGWVGRPWDLHGDPGVRVRRVASPGLRVLLLLFEGLTPALPSVCVCGRRRALKSPLTAV